MPFWFGKKQPRQTPTGGSVIQRYAADAGETKIADTPAASFAGQRESVYRKFFGDPAGVFHEVESYAPHIDVFTSILDLFANNRHSHLFDPNRKSYV
jgi:hypothetical protein